MINRDFENYYIFIVWSKASHIKDLAKKEIIKKFDLLSCGETKWSKKFIHQNFLRFYSELALGTSDKVKEVGQDSFHFFIVKDINPKFEYRSDASGRVKKVNSSIIDLKSKLRKKTDVAFGVHCSDSKHEFVQNCAMIFGSKYEATLSSIIDNKPFFVDETSKAIAESGWDSFEQLFNYLNKTTQYVVLRNPRELIDGFEHGKGDVDILCNDRKKFMSLANGIPIWESKNFFHVKVGDEMVLFDVREKGESYLDERWIEHLLNNGSVSEFQYLRTLNKDDYFFSHLYYALVNKRSIPDKYNSRLANLAKEIGCYDLVFKNGIIDKDLAIFTLKGYMLNNNFTFLLPSDPSVYINTYSVNKIFPSAHVYWYQILSRKINTKVLYYFNRLKRKLKSSSVFYSTYNSIRGMIS
ncbi:hypothetical protein [Vibrio parahaemolyticus]|uniref:hypothetical protein n=1 Tax=Vibrio parahaemolyticus TaxID=670 RepID=UPI0011CA0271|nr:hypothetical protein [Vibrio parahaemolyticus]TXM34960.1 hypothetical protein FVP00_14800 [Vibrio parahaemolyticus]